MGNTLQWCEVIDAFCNGKILYLILHLLDDVFSLLILEGQFLPFQHPEQGVPAANHQGP